ncbi:MAG: hypothetical protein JWQ19_1972 [Subtercola sp.]|nr:hypothetical protein [Subtercola sp.]
MRASSARRKFIQPARVLLAALAVGVTLAATLLAPATANAAVTATAEATSLITGPVLQQVGQSIQFARKGDDLVLPANDLKNYRVAPNGDGSFYLVLDGRCVTAGGIDDDTPATTLPECHGMASQRFFFVPVNHTPTVTGVAGAVNNEYFYIVGAERNQCLTSEKGGMNYVSGQRSNPRTTVCSETDVRQQYRVSNDRQSQSGIDLEWQNVLNLALQYGSHQCGIVTGACKVAPDGVAAGAMLEPDDPAIQGYGTIGTQLMGCGGPYTGIDPPTATAKYTNIGTSPASKSIGSSQTFTTSRSVSDSLGGSVSFESTTGLKDVWGLKISGSFNYNHTMVSVDSTASTRNDAVSTPIPGGYTSMSSWTSQVYTITGLWSMDRNLSVTGSGTLAWTFRATSSYPLITSDKGPGTWASVTTLNEKSCIAGPAATLDVNSADSLPQLTSDLSSCPAFPAPAASPVRHPTAPTGVVGSTVYVCPGNWIVPAASAGAANYHYKWFVTAGSSQEKHYISSADAYTIQSETTAGTTGALYLGVEIADLGPAARLESDYVTNLADFQLVRPELGAPEFSSTSFVGYLPQTRAGDVYQTKVVETLASGDVVSADPAAPLPDGLSLSADGVLSGTLDAPGDYTFGIRSTGSASVTTFTLSVLAQPVGFSDQQNITTTVGAAVSTSLVSDAPKGMNLQLTEGTLPPGFSLDPATGALTGTASASGSYSFAVGNAGTLDTTPSFTVTVADAPTQFITTAYTAARVGEAYSAPVTSQVGTGALIGLNGQDQSLPPGFLLDPSTGVLAGTPTTAGTFTFAIADLTDPTNTQTVVLIVSSGSSTAVATPVPTGAAEASTSSTPGSLAATGAPVIGLLTVAVLGLLAGGSLLLLRRKRRSTTR